MGNVTIYHNPRCSKSRQTLALLEENGVVVHCRRQRGDDVAAACGQLALKGEKSRKLRISAP